MSETASTVRLDDSGSADSGVDRSSNILLFAIIPYRPTTYLGYYVVLVLFSFWAEFQKTQHVGLLLIIRRLL